MKCSKCNSQLISKEESVIMNYNWGLNWEILPLINVQHKECFKPSVFGGIPLGPGRLLIQKIWIYVLIGILAILPLSLIITQHISLGTNSATIAFLVFEVVVLIMAVRSLIAIYGYQKLPSLS